MKPCLPNAGMAYAKKYKCYYKKSCIYYWHSKKDVSPIRGNLVEISRNSDDSDNAFDVNDYGNVNDDDVDNSNGNVVRP